jgi:hypothetical protein
MRSLSMFFALWMLPATLLAANEPANPPGLLFYLLGDRGFRADYAARGKPEPNFLKDVKILPGGARGSYLQCGNDQLLSYWAPGNIYSQRGTLSFYWRSREPVDAAEFPVSRVGYGDHSSWDMVWLRIDYNGHGFDAFVTDVNLGRTRVGSVDAPAGRVVVRDREGKMIASGRTPALKAPVDLFPKTATVTITLPAGADWNDGSVSVEPGGSLPEITQMNNRVQLH